VTRLAELKDKKIVVLGAGLTGLSCVRFLHAHNISFTVNDSRENPFTTREQEAEFLLHAPQQNIVSGYWDKTLINNAEVIVTSPGIDLNVTGIADFIDPKSEIIGDVELFCQINNQRINPISILAVTGSNGKSTVVSILAYLAKVLGVNAGLGGNIGQGVLDFLSLDQASNTQAANQVELLIMELSSFQLETLTSMQALAASVLNISDDHLDRHQTLLNYQTIKQSIYRQSHIAVINRDDKLTNSPVTAQKVISFGSDKPETGHFGLGTLNSKTNLMFGNKALVSIDSLPLAGLHNALNYLATLALGYSAGWSLTAMVENLAGFPGLSHRCQRVNSADNIQWINDSKATNVGATIAAISGLAPTLSSSNKLILIAGGDGKGADFSPLKILLYNDVHTLITFGKDGDKIARLMPNALRVDSMELAVKTADAVASAGDMVLLSPACASIDMFKNFIQRGESFIACIKELETLAEVEHDRS
jgi:UDP-N-acetylmuramoylalanine--D-glutamate ligase